MNQHRPYAAGTKVPEMQTFHELKRVMLRYGAEQFGTYGTLEAEVVMFAFNGLTYRFTLPMPTCEADLVRIREAARQSKRAIPQGENAMQQERDRRMRALLAVIRAKLIAIDEGITTFEQEFLPHVVTGDGRTVAEATIPALAEGVRRGSIPKSLPIPGGRP
jgi:hypothetical protein